MTRTPSLHWLTRIQADVPGDSDWLTVQELDTLSEKHVLKRRADWRLGRWTAKCAVGVFFSESSTPFKIDEIEITAAPDGAPEILLAGRPAPISISISHSAGVCLCVIRADGGPVGCDIELVETRDERLMKDFFAPEEISFIKDCSAKEAPLLTNLVWSAKESTLKTIREGLRRDTRSILVHVGEIADSRTWQSLTVECVETSRVFHGWWRAENGYVYTMTADQPVGVPVALTNRRDGKS